MILKLIESFSSVADKVILTPIMGSREINTYGIDSKQLQDKIDGAYLLETFQDVADFIKQNAKPNDLVITLGCGDIYKAAKLILE